MFIGHYAVGLAAKKIAPDVSLGTAFIACQLLDLMWPVLLLLGVERAEVDPGNTVVTPLNFTHYPFSHSLAFVLLWALVFGGLYYLLRTNRRGALVVGGLVVSHWLLDLIVHRPDLPVLPSGPYVGLGLWNHFTPTLIFELAAYVLGALIYLRATVARSGKGASGIAVLLLLLPLIYFANLFGPPPPNITAVAIAGNLLWLFVIFAYWADKHRELRP